MFEFYDYVWMAVYMIGLLGITFYLRRAASTGMDDYYLGGRKIPWWAMGISGMASQLDMTGTMLLVSLLTLLGPQGMYVEVRGGLALLLAFAMVFQGKWNRRSGCMTVAEWMEFRFGSGRAGQMARMIQAVAMLIATIGMLAYFVKGSGLFLSIFFPYPPEVCALVLIVIATFYTTLTGFYGVIYTDLFQAIFIAGAMVVVAWIAVPLVPNGPEFAAMAADLTGYANWGSTAIPWEAELPKAYEGFRLFAISLIYYAIFTTLVGASRAGGKPMYFGARSDRECGKLSLTWIVCSAIRWPLVIGFVIIGIHLGAKLFPDKAVIGEAATIIKREYPQAQPHSWGTMVSNFARNQNLSDAVQAEMTATLGADWRDKVGLVGYHGDLDKEQILPAAIKHSIPAGLRGLIFIALIAAAMSTFDSQLNMSAAYFVRDIYQRWWRRGAGQKELIRVSHITCVVIVALSFAMGYYAKSINDIWGWIMLGLGGGLALPAVLRWFWWRFNGWGYTLGTASGMVGAIMQRMLFPDVPVWVSFPSILGISAVGCVLGTFLTAPADHAVVANFYAKTRPFGFWKPFKSALPVDQQASITRENRFDLAAICFAVPGQFFLYWVPVVWMLKDWPATWVGTISLGVCSIALYFFWYRPLPRD